MLVVFGQYVTISFSFVWLQQLCESFIFLILALIIRIPVVFRQECRSFLGWLIEKYVCDIYTYIIHVCRVLKTADKFRLLGGLCLYCQSVH